MANLILSGINASSGQLQIATGSDSLVDSSGNPILAGGVQLLSETTSIDATSTGTTNLFTVPTSKQIVITEIVCRVTAVSGLSSVPTIGIGIAAGEDDIAPAQALTGISAIGDTFTLDVAGKAVTADASDIIKVGIDTAATATTLTLSIDLIGYIIGSTSANGTAITEWASYTPILTASSGGWTNTTVFGSSRFVGDTLEARIKVTFSAASASATDMILSLPTSVTANASAFPGGVDATIDILGPAGFLEAGVSERNGYVTYFTTTTVILRYLATNTFTPVTNTAPFTFDSGDLVTMNFSIPVT